MALTKVPSNLDSVTATTQSASDNSTNVATTAYVTTAIANLVDSSPSALNTLNELAAALNDDASFSTTVNNSIATKLPLAGGTLTGTLTGVGVVTNGARNIIQRSNDDSSITFANNASGTPSSHAWAIGLDYSASNGLAIAYANNGIPSLSGNNLVQINTSGDVGIGMSPSGYGKLSVNSTGVILALRASSGAGKLGFYEGGAGRFYLETNNGSDGLKFIDGDGSSVRMIVDGNGQIGIGTTTLNKFFNLADPSNGGEENKLHFEATGATHWAIYPYDRVNSHYPSLHLGNNENLKILNTGGVQIGNATDGILLHAHPPDGKVGIGNSSSPRSTLHVLGNNTAPPASNGAGINGLQISRTTGYSENLYLYMNSTNTGWSGSSYEARLQSFGNNALGIGSTQNIPIVFAANDAQIARFSVGSADKYVHTSGGNSAGLGGNGANLVLAGDDSEIRMANNFIHSDNSGNTKLTIRTGYAVASASAELSLDGGFVTMNVGSQYTEMLKATTSNVTIGRSGGAAYYLRCLTQYGEGSQGSLNSSYYHHSTDRGINYWGTRCEASGGFHTYSDEKLKKEITTIDGALDSVARMNGVTFKWKDPENRGGGDAGKQFGVIAQNMLEIDRELPSLNDDPLSPEETRESDDSFYTMDYTRLTPYFIEAIKELKEKNEALEARIKELEG